MFLKEIVSSELARESVSNYWVGFVDGSGIDRWLLIASARVLRHTGM
jgi:hypothetical protein